jgi:uncharacterized integral membrane protein
MNLKLVAIITLLVLAGIFVIQNTEVVELHFLFWTMTMSRALMFVLLVLIGVAIGWLLHVHLLHKMQHKR